MKILVVGGGGREHAILWKLSQSIRKPELYCAPGNAGIAGLAVCVPIKAIEIEKLAAYAADAKMDLVFVAPDDPLAMGLVDRLQERGIRAFGPTARAAVIESSKSFSKELMRKYHIPTAAYEVFTDADAAVKHIGTLEPPIVVKADGLALGKGVIIAGSREEAAAAVEDMLSGKAFGDSGRTVLIEEFLRGRELTVLAFTDGFTVVPMPNSRDHKKAFDHDEGPNTGGMGAVCPGEILSEDMEREMLETIFQPTVDAMRMEGRLFKGVIYFGLMLTADGPKVIEYNARFGDPEAQAVLPLLESDFVRIIDTVIDGQLDSIHIRWSRRASCCVVAASGGYPAYYDTGYKISGLDRTDCLVFHAGTKTDPAGGAAVTSGGRVLGVTAVADSLPEAIDIAYRNIAAIHFEGMHYRTDIGRTT